MPSPDSCSRTASCCASGALPAGMHAVLVAPGAPAEIEHLSHLAPGAGRPRGDPLLRLDRRDEPAAGAAAAEAPRLPQHHSREVLLERAIRLSPWCASWAGRGCPRWSPRPRWRQGCRRTTRTSCARRARASRASCRSCSTPRAWPHDGRGSSQEGPLVLSVGRLAPHKRPDLVIRAFALYQRAHAPDARLVFVGPAQHPAYRARLERLVEEVGARGVQLAGPVDARRAGRGATRRQASCSRSPSTRASASHCWRRSTRTCPS